MDIYEEIVRLKNERRTGALALVVQCQGSSPQKEGAKMLVRNDHSMVGTLGGGCLEADVIQAALMVMKEGTCQTISFELQKTLGALVCGGKALMYIEPVVPVSHLVILGAGHVGKALYHIACFVGFRVTVVDDREEFANHENLPDADTIVVNKFDLAFSQLRVNSHTSIVVVTRGHNHDLEAVKAALKTEALYIGLVGSRRKKSLLFNQLEQEGFSKDTVNRIIIPAGLPISSVTPEEIAISIMAQIIQHRKEHA